MKPKFPDARVRIANVEGNADEVLNRAQNALRQAGASNPDIEQFLREARAGDQSHLIETVAKWCKTR